MNNLNTETKTLGIIGLVTLIIIVGGVFLFSRNNTPKPIDQSVLIKEDSLKIGPDDAKVKIVEFADFQCPACATVSETIKQIENDYKDKVQIIYRHFPLPGHPNAKISAIAAEAANDQGKFKEMYTKLYENQTSWGNTSDPKEIFISYAKEIGLDEKKFTDALNAKTHLDKIEKDFNEGQILGINATPTFFINGIKFEGSLSYSQFKAEIEKELSK